MRLDACNYVPKMKMSGYQVGIEFTREQLVDPEYEPIAQGDVDLEDLRHRYEGHVPLDHAAAVRGILVRDTKTTAWSWIWGIGLLHDEMVTLGGYLRLYARYRNQYPIIPRIEFDDDADAHAALSLLLETTPIEENDVINIEFSGRTAFSIADFLHSDLSE